MKKVFSILASLAFAGSVFAGCPSKAIKGKFLGYDADSKTINVQSGKKQHKIQVSSKTELGDIKLADLEENSAILVEGCNCKNKVASKVALAKGKGNKEKKG